jgi:hypothetical protein
VTEYDEIYSRAEHFFGAEHSHSGGPVERHARIEAVLRKRAT